MRLRRLFGALAVLVAFSISQNAEAQRNRNRNEKEDKNKKEAPKNPAPSAKKKEEFEAFQAVQNDTNPQTRLAAADKFLTDFPDSELAGFVNRFKMETFLRMGRPKDAIAAAETAMKFEMDFYTKQEEVFKEKNNDQWKEFMQQTSRGRLYYLQNIMTSYQSMNDAPKTIEYAEQILEDSPDDLLTLLTLSSVMAERPPTDEKEKDKQMKRAEEVGKKAMTMVGQVVAGPMGATMPADQKMSLQASVHATMGLIFLNQKKYGEAQKEYLQANTFKSNDPVNHFRLGLAYAQDKPPKASEAMESLAKSVFLKGVTEAQARDILTQLYQQQKKSLDGLDQYIKDAGAKISP